MPARLPDHLRRTGAQRAADSRARRSLAGLKPSRGKSGKGGRKASLFEEGEFVAVDGEGFSEGAELEFFVGTEQRSYKGRAHYYALLKASDGSELYAPEGRLETADCLDFLLDIRARNPKAIVVCFGASYDFTQILAHGLEREQIKTLLTDPPLSETKARRQLDVTIGDSDYRLEYRPRKSFTVTRWRKGSPKFIHNENGKIVNNCDASVTVWDVWGFFQLSFAECMKKWTPNDPDYQFIVEQKGNRKHFERSEIDVIRRYNDAELRCLVSIMERLRDAVRGLGLTLARWDGAGAIAAAMLRLHKVSDHKLVAPPDVFEAARHAYSGGHIEVVQIGHYDGTVYHYDVNSAYPYHFARLPSLATGAWKHGAGDPPKGFTLVHVKYEFNYGMSFYPLFYRTENFSILYPRAGEGWYWLDEYEAAKEYAARFGAINFEVVEWWHLVSRETESPFAWVKDYYNRRLELVEASKISGVDSGEEKIIKLGLNSLYGKTAQQVGARIDEDGVKAPPYFQIEWAGFVTAGCRAQLMRAAISDPVGIISFATDGIFSTRPLDVYAPKRKELGAWESQTHDGITMVMPGVYWLHDGQKVKHYSRGFDKDQMPEAWHTVHSAWRQRVNGIPFALTRLIGLGSAVASESFWQMRGMFVSSHRELALDGKNSKRYPVSLYAKRLDKNLAATQARENESHEISALYAISWLGVDMRSVLEEEREAIDADLA